LKTLCPARTVAGICSSNEQQLISDKLLFGKTVKKFKNYFVIYTVHDYGSPFNKA